jgi:tetratricopeptide (TPR) repeat protein
MSVCNGAMVLAKGGLLDGLKATTHFGSIDRLRQFPSVTVLPDERFVDNGHIVTTQGVSAGIDGALHVVQRLLGDEAAWSDARYMMYHWEPAGLSPQAKEELRPWVEQDWKTVQSIYERKTAADPKDAIAATRLGVAQEELAQHERAVATLERAVALGAKEAIAFDDLGQAHFALGHFETAARSYEKLIPLTAPRARPFAQVQLARAWSRAGKQDEALAALQKATASGAIQRKLIESDAAFAGLHHDARWTSMLERCE